jgi:hypothetical protein
MGRTRAGVALLLLLGTGATARAESNLSAEEPPASQRPSRWGLAGNIGAGWTRGDFSSLLDTPVSGELNVFRTQGPWRFGLGVSFGSFNMKTPYANDLEWGFQRTYLFATRMLVSEGRLRPYMQVRAGAARLHPRSHLFDQIPLPDGFVLGNSSTQPANGFSVSVVPGLEWNLNRSVAFDLSADFGYFNVSKSDLSTVGLSQAGSGSTAEVRFGVRWHPDNGHPSGVRPRVPEDGPRDAWGVSRNYGWAAAEMLGINWVSSAYNEYGRNGNFNQISPRSWWSNLKDGFTYDDNEFRTNQFVHSYNGSAYFNSARANGLNYWTSVAYATFGAFWWECCGETHPMSLNDMVATSMGGWTLGETWYRLSSEVLDNQATGKGRFFKELGSFFIDPVRGLNRLISGRSRAIDANPTDPMDWRPPHGASLVGLGARIIGQGESISHDTKTYTNLTFDHAYGSPFDNTRRKPFDYLDMALQFSAGEKQPLNVLRVRGDLWEKPLGNADAPNHVFAISQYYDYLNNNAFEFGGQSIVPTLHSRFRLSDKLGLTTRVGGVGLVLGAVNSDYSKIANVADRERLREYDYGPGLGVDSAASLIVSGRPLLSVLYRFQWISVSNGSVFSKGKSSQGSDANHYLQAVVARLVVPIFGNLGLGADGSIFLRKSRYSAPGFADVDQRNPQVRVFVAVNSAR